MDMTARARKSPEAETRIQSAKPIYLSNGVLKRHAPPPMLYKECLKNHAAGIGGHALDGCGEFMPAPNATASDPTTSFKCAACGCHRNFHRREPEVLTAVNTATHVIEYHPHHRHHPLPPLSSARCGSPPPISSTYAPHMLLALSTGVGGGPEETIPTTNNAPNSASRKRFRTKFSQDQKEKMLEFAEKVGWKMHKTNEVLVNGFCNEIGIERGVFKVWMHNNKNTFGKRSNTNTITTTTNPTDDAAVIHANQVDDEDVDEDIGNLNGNGNDNSNSNSSSINNNHHHLQNGGNSNAAPTNASSSSS